MKNTIDTLVVTTLLIDGLFIYSCKHYIFKYEKFTILFITISRKNDGTLIISIKLRKKRKN